MAVIQHEVTLAEAADRLGEELPGHRVEILLGSMVVTPPLDGPHQMTLTWLIEQFFQVGARQAGVRCLQGIGLWLPTGPGDYAVPDLAVVDADFRDALAGKNCYEPQVFRLVLEVTSSNWSNDTGLKAEAYAKAQIPAYVVVDRKHDQVLVQTDPEGGVYKTVTAYKRGSSVPLPDVVGVSLDLAVDHLLDGGEE